MRLKQVIAFCGVACWCCYSPQVFSSDNKTVLITASIEQVFKPAATAFEQATADLTPTLIENCRDDDARQAFATVVTAFSEMEFYQLGAISQENRAERLFFWPDQKSRGRKQILRWLGDPQREILSVAELTKKSVALQGLPALEHILFGDMAGRLGKDCALATVISQNIAGMANDIRDDWYAPDGIVNDLLNSNPELLYHDEDEAVGAVVNQAVQSIHAINGLKLARIIEALEQSGVIPSSMPFQLSSLTLENIQGNITALRRLLLDGGFAHYAGIEEKLTADFNRASASLGRAGQALSLADMPTAVKRLQVLRQLLIDINIAISVTIAPKLEVIPGFNGRDGD